MKEKESGTKYQETKQHGSRLFPFNIYPCTIPLDFPAVPLHWHKEMELIYIKKGKGLIQIETKSFEGEPGDIFVVTPGTLHAIHRINFSNGRHIVTQVPAPGVLSIFIDASSPYIV